MVARAAAVLGRTQEAADYARLSDAVRTAIHKEYFTPTGRLAVPTQTGYLLALFMELAPDEHRERVQNDFIERIKQDNMHLRTGFVGTPYLCRVLSHIGANDIAYKLLLNEDFPSWLYAVNLGATTIWERWNALNPDGSIRSPKLNSHDPDGSLRSAKMNSLNHYAYGSIVEWMFRDMCGLNPTSGDDTVTGFRAARIAPKPDQSLQWARARYRSAAGLYESSWRIDDTGYLTIEITIPFNTSAIVVLPDAQMGDILINGRRLHDGEQIGESVELTLGAGRYRFEYQMREKGVR